MNVLGEVGILHANISLCSRSNKAKHLLWGVGNKKCAPPDIISTLCLSMEEQVGMLIKSFWVGKGLRETEVSNVPLLSGQAAEPVQGQEGESIHWCCRPGIACHW